MALHPVANSLSLPRPSRFKGITMKRTTISILALLLSGSAAFAAGEPSRIRGTITSVDTDKIVVHTAAGADLPIALGAGTKYLQVVKSSLDKVEKDSYIGTATKTVGSNLIALEVVVFPAAMKGAGDGHYDWDKIPDTTLSGKSYASSSMTNGSVTAVSTPSSATVHSAMTNGSVSSASNEKGVKKLTVTYKGGQQTILVPPTAPIVTFLPGSTSDLTKGAAVFIQATKDGDATAAALVAVGKDGLTPPM
jgi:hypothetical protein